MKLVGLFLTWFFCAKNVIKIKALISYEKIVFNITFLNAFCLPSRKSLYFY